MDTTQVPPTQRQLFIKKLIRKVVTMTIVTLVFGYVYGWASVWAFPEKRTSGFAYGMLHGALMPLSLPSLIIGKNVEIYAVNNSGRIYKIGYICGINLCGLAFFGSAFWSPKQKIIKTSSGKSQ